MFTCYKEENEEEVILICKEFHLHVGDFNLHAGYGRNIVVVHINADKDRCFVLGTIRFEDSLSSGWYQSLRFSNADHVVSIYH